MKKGFTITVDDKDLKSLLNRALSQNPAATKRAIESVTLHLKGEAQRRAPVDTGLLRSSAYADVKSGLGNVTGEVGFNAPYALRQHEELNFNHPKGGEAKYLENAFNESLPQIKERFKKVIKESFE